MKIFKRITLFFTLFCSLHMVVAEAKTIKKESITMNKREVMTDVLIDNDMSSVAVRDFFTGLGYVVEWKGDQELIELRKSGELIVFRLHENYLYKNGFKKFMPKAAFLEDGRAFMPLVTVENHFDLSTNILKSVEASEEYANTRLLRDVNIINASTSDNLADVELVNIDNAREAISMSLYKPKLSEDLWSVARWTDYDKTKYFVADVEQWMPIFSEIDLPESSKTLLREELTAEVQNLFADRYTLDGLEITSLLMNIDKEQILTINVTTKAYFRSPYVDPDTIEEVKMLKQTDMQSYKKAYDEVNGVHEAFYSFHINGALDNDRNIKKDTLVFSMAVNGDLGAIEGQEPISYSHSFLSKSDEDKLAALLGVHANKILTDAKKSYTAFEKEAAGNLETSYEVLTNNDDFLSINIIFLLTDGSSSHQNNFYTIEKESGNLLSLKGLFAKDSNYVDKLSTYIRKEMNRQIDTENAVYWINEVDMPGEAFTKIKEDQHFYINKDNHLVIIFDKYEVAPGSSGSPKFVIPFEIIESITVNKNIK